MLTDEIRRTALRIIADTSLHPRWDDAAMNKKQRTVFDALATNLALAAAVPFAGAAVALHRTMRFRDRRSSRLPLARGQMDASERRRLLHEISRQEPDLRGARLAEAHDPASVGDRGSAAQEAARCGDLRRRPAERDREGADRSEKASCRRDLEGFRGPDDLSLHPAHPDVGSATRISTRRSAPEPGSRRVGLF